MANGDGLIDEERERERKREDGGEGGGGRDDYEEARQELVASTIQDGESCMRLATPPEG